MSSTSTVYDINVNFQNSLAPTCETFSDIRKVRNLLWVVKIIA